MVKPKNMLRKKLCRDMSRAAMQFLSIIALCALGTFAFSALDGMARMIRTTLNTYYEENNLADFWITLPTADRASMEKLAALPDVEAVCARASVDLDTTLPGDVSVSVTVYDGEMTINKPLLREGALLEANDPRGCLVEERFAQSKGLSLGDRLTVKLRGRLRHSGTAADADRRHHSGRRGQRNRAGRDRGRPARRAGCGSHRAQEHGARQQRRADV